MPKRNNRQKKSRSPKKRKKLHTIRLKDRVSPKTKPDMEGARSDAYMRCAADGYWEEAIEDYIEEKRPKQHQVERNVLHILCGRMPDCPPPWTDTDWASFLTMEIYLYLDAPRFGQGMALALLDRFLTWQHRRGEFEEDVLSDMLDAVDEQRYVTEGLTRKRAPHGRPVGEELLKFDIERFIQEREKELGPFFFEHPQLVHRGIRSIYAYLKMIGHAGRFDAIDPCDYVVFLISDGHTDGARAILFLCAHFIDYLSSTVPAYVTPAHAQKLAAECRRIGAGLVANPQTLVA